MRIEKESLQSISFLLKCITDQSQPRKYINIQSQSRKHVMCGPILLLSVNSLIGYAIRFNYLGPVNQHPLTADNRTVEKTK